MVELGWQIGGEDLGTQSCDGVICCTPSGSTAYNLSNGGPVMMWGLEAMAITFVAPHSLFARPLVVPRGLDLRIANRTAGGRPVTVLVDGQAVGEMGASEDFSVGVGADASLLALLPEVTFFTRYHDVFLYA
jgi:NAD+ kinase